MDNWIGIREKATGTIKPLLAYQPGECVTITLLHPTKPLEPQPLQIDFFYAPPHSVRKTRVQAHAPKRVIAQALPVGSIIVDHDSLKTNPERQDEQLELSLSVDKSYHLHAVLKKAHAPSPVFPFIISQVQFHRCRLRFKGLTTHQLPVAAHSATDKDIQWASHRANTKSKRPFSLIKLFIGVCFGILGLLMVLLFSAWLFPDFNIPFLNSLLKTGS